MFGFLLFFVVEYCWCCGCDVYFKLKIRIRFRIVFVCCIYFVIVFWVILGMFFCGEFYNMDLLILLLLLLLVNCFWSFWFIYNMYIFVEDMFSFDVFLYVVLYVKLFVNWYMFDIILMLRFVKMLLLFLNLDNLEFFVIY